MNICISSIDKFNDYLNQISFLEHTHPSIHSSIPGKFFSFGFSLEIKGNQLNLNHVLEKF